MSDEATSRRFGLAVPTGRPHIEPLAALNNKRGPVHEIEARVVGDWGEATRLFPNEHQKG